MMAVYFIVKIELKDPEKYKDYLAVVPKIIENYGGKAIVRGGKTETLEREPENRRMVILEFPSQVKAEEFYYSKAYQDAKKLRENIATGQLVLVEGID